MYVNRVFPYLTNSGFRIIWNIMKCLYASQNSSIGLCGPVDYLQPVVYLGDKSTLSRSYIVFTLADFLSALFEMEQNLRNQKNRLNPQLGDNISLIANPTRSNLRFGQHQIF